MGLILLNISDEGSLEPGNRLTICLKSQENQENVCRDGRPQDSAVILADLEVQRKHSVCVSEIKSLLQFREIFTTVLYRDR
jgi:hypothetical protein